MIYFNNNVSFNTQPPEGGWYAGPEMTQEKLAVSTHSRPKAAGAPIPPAFGLGYCFNTQPPEGGWLKGGYYAFNLLKFQHTAARRRLANYDDERVEQIIVSTHSRPKAAGASLKSLAPSGFAALISLSSQEKREREYNTAFSVTPTFAIS